jgi:hypothetical protein
MSPKIEMSIFLLKIEKIFAKKFLQCVVLAVVARVVDQVATCYQVEQAAALQYDETYLVRETSGVRVIALPLPQIVSP